MAILDEHAVVFWVFLIFFVLIGITSLAVVIGLVRAGTGFRAWSFGTFFASIVSVVVAWANKAPYTFEVTIPPPQEKQLLTTKFEIVSANLEIQDGEPQGTHKKTVHLDVIAGQNPGSTIVKIPYQNADHPILLKLQDATGKSWRTRRFYPYVTTQELVPEMVAQADYKADYASFMSPISSAFAEGGAFSEDGIKFRSCAIPFIKSDDNNTRSYYKWRIFLEDWPDNFGIIKEVDYVLPKSFTKPIVALKYDQKNNNFEYQSSAYEDFPIEVDIYYCKTSSNDDSCPNETKTIQHTIHLSEEKCDDYENLLNGSKILWVDDNPQNNRLEVNALTASGIRIMQVTNTADALNALRNSSENYDVIISDFERKIDTQDGYALLDKIKTSNNPPPYIIYSASSDKSKIDDAKQHGAFGETNQPDQLLDLIIKSLARH